MFQPIKKIPSFSFEYPWLKRLDLDLNSVIVNGGQRTIRATWTPELAQDVSAFHNIDAETELTALLSQEISRQIDLELINVITRDLVPVQPLDLPRGQLFYFDFVYDQNVEEPTVYSDGSWSLGNNFESSIGFKIEIRPFNFI